MLVVHESQISLSVWDRWLYKRLLTCPDMVIGQCFLHVGQSAAHQSRSETQAFYVGLGRGRVESGEVFTSPADPERRSAGAPGIPTLPKSALYEPTLLFSIEPQTIYALDCWEATELFVIRCVAGTVPVISREILSDKERRTHLRGQFTTLSMENDSLLITDGEAILRVGGQAQPVGRGHVVHLPAEGDLIVENAGSGDCSYIRATVRSVNTTIDEAGFVRVH